MLKNWFTKESAEKSDEGPITLKDPSAVHLPEEPPRKYPRHSLANPLSTPHDVLLSDPAELSPESQSRNNSPLYDVPAPSKAAIAPGLDILSDPFDGSVLGKMSLPDPNLTQDTIPMGEEITHNEELWSHLSRVLDLQSDIAKLHMGMEGIIGEYGKTKAKGKAAPKLGGDREAMETRSKLARNLSTLDDLENVGADAGVGAEDDQEERKNREREEEFARLADQFEGRKEGINEIMLKALTEFHALQAPQLSFPSSRQNSMPVGSLASSPATSMDKRSTFTPMPPITPIISTAAAQRPARVLSPTRMMDSPISTADSAVFPKH
ncbi:hypothetical protein V5O48_002542 [Marasmius crinis-equi]|uniref:Uncharacterized protein n=1 Tax=Marasmius crinis-equi TaxID=585013 RepID=A0ABR3FVC9_9AGAR